MLGRCNHGVDGFRVLDSQTNVRCAPTGAIEREMR
jgi:hypothetical protein